MFEHRKAPLLSTAAFLRRLARHGVIAALFVSLSLALGTVGYHVCGELPWIDALLNASMILTGMGPVDPMRTTVGKLFSTFYALFSGVAFLTTIAVLYAPVVHRFLHRLHVDIEQG